MILCMECEGLNIMGRFFCEAPPSVKVVHTTTELHTLLKYQTSIQLKLNVVVSVCNYVIFL